MVYPKPKAGSPGVTPQEIPVWVLAGVLQGRTLNIWGLQGYVGRSLRLLVPFLGKTGP